MAQPSKFLSVYNKGETVAFPFNLGQSGVERYISFEAGSINKGDRIQPAEFVASKGRVCLPIPANLVESLNYAWSSDALGGLNALTQRDFWGWGNVTASKLAKSLAGGVGLVAAGVDPEASQRAQNVWLNPRLANQFVATDFRDHQFQFNLIAKSQDESVAIQNIIHFFRYFGAPGLSGEFGVIMEEPDRFMVKFEPDDHFLFTPGICVLVAINVTYNGSGVPVFFKDTHAPVEIMIDLVMKESQILFKKTIDARYGRTGWGSG